MRHFDEETETLSPEGASRRERMLPLLQQALARQRRRRLAARWSLAACLLAGTFAAYRIAGPPSVTPAPEPRAPVGPKLAHMTFSLVRDDPSILTRLSALGNPPDPGILVADRPLDPTMLIRSDEELMQLLAEAGHPQGLVRVNGRLILDLPEPPNRAP